MNNTFSIQESFSFAWKTFTARPWFLIGVALAMFVLVGVTSAILRPSDGGNIIFTLISVVINIFIDMGLVAFALQAHENVQSVHWKTLWVPSKFWKYLAANILVGLIVLAGLILLVIPGIIAALGLMFTKYLVIDRNLGPVEALKESWRIAKKHLFSLFLLILAVLVLNIAGAIALGVGLLVTVPITMLVMVHVYRELEHSAHEVVTA